MANGAGWFEVGRLAGRHIHRADFKAGCVPVEIEIMELGGLRGGCESFRVSGWLGAVTRRRGGGEGVAFRSLPSMGLDYGGGFLSGGLRGLCERLA